MKTQSGFVISELIGILIIVFSFVGWVANIVKLFGSSFDPLTGIVVIRVVGIFVAPLGAIVGYL